MQILHRINLHVLLMLKKFYRYNDANKRPVVSGCTMQESSTAMDIDTNEEEKKDDNNNIKTAKKSNRQYKYMTNSQLLHLQL